MKRRESKPHNLQTLPDLPTGAPRPEKLQGPFRPERKRVRALREGMKMARILTIPVKTLRLTARWSHYLLVPSVQGVFGPSARIYDAFFRSQDSDDHCRPLRTCCP